MVPRSLRAQDVAPALVPAQADGAAKAEAIELDAKVPSVLMLDPTSKVWSLQVTSKSRLDVQAGDVVINSTNAGALWNADGTIEAKGAIRVVGGTTYLGRHTVNPVPLTSAEGVEDSVPSFGIEPGPMLSGQKLFLNNEPTVTLRPGVYTGGIFATGEGSVITMEPGTYIINGGDFFVSGARLQGQGGTIAMSGAQPGAFWCASGVQLDLSAPTQGPLRNIVLVARAHNNRGLQLDGAQGQLKGLVYAPQATASLSSKSDVTMDRLFCSSLGLTLGAQLHVTGQSLTLEPPKTPEVDAQP